MQHIKIRQSNLELLRIVSMLMIVGLHYFNGQMGGGALAELTASNYNYYVTYLFESLLVVSVGCFVLITGYFQIEKTSIKINKAFKIVIQVTFYAVFFFIVVAIVGEESFSISKLVGNILFPVLSNWFTRIYLILYILSPYLNICLNNLNKSEYKKLLIILIILFSVWPSFIPYSPVTDSGYGIITLILFYIIGGYIKKHYKSNHSKKYYFVGYLLCAIITFILSMLFPEKIGCILGYNFIFNIVGSIFMFLAFTKINIKSTKINYLSGFAFGVFLIHTNGNIRSFIYERILHSSLFFFSPFLIVHAVISILMIYLLSTLVDICRKWLFDRVEKYIIPPVKKIFPILWEQLP